MTIPDIRNLDPGTYTLPPVIFAFFRLGSRTKPTHLPLGRGTTQRLVATSNGPRDFVFEFKIT